MIRLFFTLYLVIMLAATTFVFGINPLMQWAIKGFVADNEYKNFRGTVHLLDNYLTRHPNYETDQSKQAELQNLFGYSVALIDKDKAKLTNTERELLNEHGATTTVLDEAEFLFAPSRVAQNKLWRIQEEQTLSEQNHNIAIGTFNLILQQLDDSPSERWPQELEKLQPNFDVPLSLIRFDGDEINALSEEKREQLKGKRVVTETVSEFEETYYYWSQKNDWVIVGKPVEHHPFIQALLPVIVLLLAVFIGISVYIWVAPVWSHLNKLQKASTAFGEGRFDARTKTVKFSPINNIALTFNTMAARVEGLIASHKELTNAVSHELRTPLARMRFSLAMLDDPSITDEQKRYLNEMAMDVDALDSLVAELLTYARFERERPELHITETELVPWIEQLSERAQGLTNTVNVNAITEHLTSSETAKIDCLLVSRAISNLLQNAIKYGNTCVNLSAEIAHHKVIITVEDDGNGIPEEKWKDIFSPFTRVDDSRNRSTGGFGIGLAIVDQITQWHDGTVEVSHSKNLSGACFTLSLPLTPEAKR